ncbi:hypothetical protein BDB00DRAFT_802633 [Zychaea mexicana]|uniref:uncharacterized protein n=1 Tax=Zychaea mexicana TaxID=64656 RepID=UPI0022FDBA57|nr:uncharacterized protein BDB00DRAFT_802633 [Zychaea mexicana]KAI9497927.1 hypothetical protein BDB00DRAFT_802633 [Zychaea mexicana]
MCPPQPLHPRWLQPVSAPMPTPTAFTSRNHPLRCPGRTPSPDEGGDRQTHQSTSPRTRPNDRHGQRNDRPTTMSSNPPDRKRNDDRIRTANDDIGGIDDIDGHRRHRRA